MWDNLIYSVPFVLCALLYGIARILTHIGRTIEDWKSEWEDKNYPHVDKKLDEYRKEQDPDDE